MRTEDEDSGPNAPVQTEHELFIVKTTRELDQIQSMLFTNDPIPVEEAIMKHYPEALQEAGITIVSYPPTQVSVERIFSALKILKSDIRNRLNEDIVNACLFLKSNFMV